jgi:hypothetical protein
MFKLFTRKYLDNNLMSIDTMFLSFSAKEPSSCPATVEQYVVFLGIKSTSARKHFRMCVFPACSINLYM